MIWILLCYWHAGISAFTIFKETSRSLQCWILNKPGRQLRVVAWMHITFCPSLSKVIKCTPTTKGRDWHPIYSESNYWWGEFSIDGIWNFNSKSPTLKIISSWRLELFYCSSVVHRADLFHSSSGTMIWPEFSSDLYNNKSWQKWVHLCVIHLSLNRHHRHSS